MAAFSFHCREAIKQLTETWIMYQVSFEWGWNKMQQPCMFEFMQMFNNIMMKHDCCSGYDRKTSEKMCSCDM